MMVLTKSRTPPGTGTNLPIIISVDGQNVTGQFSYNPPTILGSSVSDTAGGVNTLSGKNFGLNIGVVYLYVAGL